MTALLIALTYAAEALGFLGIVGGMVMLVLSGPPTSVADSWPTITPTEPPSRDELARLVAESEARYLGRTRGES